MKNISHDTILEKIGGFSRYQFALYICLQLGITLYGSNLAVVVPFGSVIPEKTCKEAPINSTVQECDWTYPFYSFGVEWNLTGSRKHLVATTNTVQMFGQLSGPVLMCYLADRLGRRPILLFAFLGLSLTQIATAYSVNWYMLTAFRYLAGYFQGACQVIHFIHYAENTPQKYRSLGYLPGFAAGFLVTALWTFFVHNWRNLQWFILAPAPVVCVMLIFYVKESPLWLLSMNHRSKAKTVLKFMARQNRELSPDTSLLIDDYVHSNIKSNTLSEEKEGEVAEEHAETYSYVDLFRKQFRATTLALLLSRATVSLMHFTFLASMGTLVGNLSLNVVIVMLLRIVAAASLVGLERQSLVKIGRKHLLGIGIGVSLIVSFAVATLNLVVEYSWGDTNALGTGVRILSIVGLTFTTYIWVSVDVLSAEAFPTQIRNAGTGLAMTISRMGSMMAPHLAFLYYVWRPIPGIVCGCLMLINFFVMIFFVPETKGKELPSLPVKKKG